MSGLPAWFDVVTALAFALLGVCLFTGRLVAASAHDAMRAESDRMRAELRAAQDRNHFVRAIAFAGEANPHRTHEVVPVETGGEVVAHLCVDCDKQLPADYSKPHPSEQAVGYEAPRRLADGSGWEVGE